MKMRGLLITLPLLVAGVFAVTAAAAVPQNTARPTISGTLKDGSTLTASTGTWSNSPTSFSYQWQRCASDGTSCANISGATGKTYRLVSADVVHTLRVTVTASNSSGKAAATSDATSVINSRNGPTNTSRPVISGTAVAGDQLSVSAGTWTPALTSEQRQWVRCSSSGTSCVNISGATGSTYVLHTADVGHRLRVLVTGTDTGGKTSVITSASDVVTAGTTVTTTTTNTVTTTVQGNHAPTVKFISLRRIGVRVYARFRICDDTPGAITVVARDNKARVLSATHRFHVTLQVDCSSYARSWIPPRRFRGSGRLVVSLRAIDSDGALSLIRSRSVRTR
jgi:Ig domain of plant-specific actin-binding protein